MSRQTPRRKSRTGVYHVGIRGARRLPIFADDRDRSRYIGCLEHSFDRHGGEVLSYCLLGNHLHLLIKVDDHTQLESIMHLVGTRYVPYFNRRHGLDGRLATDRYWSDPVEDDRRLLTTARYIERNALDIRPGQPLEEYVWGSLGAIVGRRAAPAFLNTGRILDAHGGTPVEFLEFVSRTLPSDRVVDWADPPPRAEVTADASTIRQVVSGIVGDVARNVNARSRRALTTQATLVLCDIKSCPTEDLTTLLDLNSTAVLHSLRHQGQKRLLDDPLFAAIVDTARATLRQDAA